MRQALKVDWTDPKEVDAIEARVRAYAHGWLSHLGAYQGWTEAPIKIHRVSRDGLDALAADAHEDAAHLAEWLRVAIARCWQN